MISESLRRIVVESATHAASLGDGIEVCPYAAQSTPTERALARLWVSAYLAAAPPAPGDISYDAEQIERGQERRYGTRFGSGHRSTVRRWTPDTQPRWPGGSPRGGQFARAGSGGGGGGGGGSDLPRRGDRPVPPAVTGRPSAQHLLSVGASGDLDRLQSEWSRVLDGTYGGLQVSTVDALELDAVDGGGVLASAEIFDAAGNSVGQVTRIIQDDGQGPYAVHAQLVLQPHLQGHGFAREFNAHLDAWYREAGVDRIELVANIDVGGYTWARAGFDFKDETDAVQILGRLQTTAGMWERGIFGRPIPPERVAEQIAAADELLDRARTATFGTAGYPSAYEVSQLGRWPGAGRDDWWIGKATLMGSTWNGVRPL